MEINWLDEIKFSIGNRQFQAAIELDQLWTLKASDGYIVGKEKSILEKYCSYLDDMKITNIVELGIFRGGSTIFFNEYCNPEKLVAIDFCDKCVDLDRYIEEEANNSIVKPYYKIDQSDVESLHKITKDEFGGEPLDLVVDDASHLLNETRASFNALFPKLRPGGLYIIEDWSWVHAADSKIINQLSRFEGKPALTNIIFEVIMACGTNGQLIEEVIVTETCCFIRKGASPEFEEGFNISSSSSYRGKMSRATDYL
jgi:cephalosporin hydroxylase